MDIKKFYEQNKDFKNYVSKYCKSYNCSIETALDSSVVHCVAEYYKKLESEEPMVYEREEGV